MNGALLFDIAKTTTVVVLLIVAMNRFFAAHRPSSLITTAIVLAMLHRQPNLEVSIHLVKLGNFKYLFKKQGSAYL